MGDDNTVVKVQKKFIDYAADMGWEYTLVDSAWDRQIGYDGLKELVEYGRPKNVKILIWYNSAGEWNTTPLTPRDRMFDPSTRRAELQKIKDLGIAGVKVDFFAGDAQSTIAYYHDILEDAARIGLTANFHGATLPRGWQRTYPNLMTMEAVRGLEFNTFEQRNAEEVADASTRCCRSRAMCSTRWISPPWCSTGSTIPSSGVRRRHSNSRPRCCSRRASSTLRRYPPAWPRRRRTCATSSKPCR